MSTRFSTPARAGRSQHTTLGGSSAGGSAPGGRKPSELSILISETSANGFQMMEMMDLLDTRAAALLLGEKKNWTRLLRSVRQ